MLAVGEAADEDAAVPHVAVGQAWRPCRCVS
jgi:hypothetical protein